MNKKNYFVIAIIFFTQLVFSYEMPKMIFNSDTLSVSGDIDPEFYTLIKDELYSRNIKILDLTKVKSTNDYYDEFVVDNLYFDNFKSANTIILPQNAEVIGHHLFMHCDSLKKVILSEKLYDIRETAFVGCYNLENIEIPSQNKRYLSKEGILYDYAIKKLVACPGKKSISVLPLSITEFGTFSFYGCSIIKELVCPPNLLTIGDMAFYKSINLENIEFNDNLQTIGNNAFFGCEKIKEITLPSSLKTYGMFAFSCCSQLEIVNIKGDYFSNHFLFGSCNNLREINAIGKSSLKSIGGVLFDNQYDVLLAFPNAKSEEYQVSKTVSTIGKCAFFECMNLKRIWLSSSIKKIEEAAFSGCTGLEEIHIEGNEIIKLKKTSFSRVNKDKCKVFVPEKMVDLYRKDPFWKQFANIVSENRQ